MTSLYARGMSRTLLLALLLVVLGGCVATRPDNPRNVCSMFEERRSWFRAAEQAEEHWGVPVPVTMAFIYQESSFQARARPPRGRLLGFIPWLRPSSARGYAQALDITWNEYKEQTGNRLGMRSHFPDAVDFIGWYNRNSVQRNGIAAHDARNLYLAYHEGNGGYARGTWRDKPWLIETAGRVQANADRYAEQYSQCRGELARPWWQRIFF
ncbi:MAG: hypothetical protein WEB57_05455 [Pseudohongiellaceae bacterium]